MKLKGLLKLSNWNFVFFVLKGGIIIFRMVKEKFDQIMQSNVQYKAHKVLSGILMTSNGMLSDAKVVAIATGTKCISDKSGDENGTILHDMHAEVLTRRSFVRFLYNQLTSVLNSTLLLDH